MLLTSGNNEEKIKWEPEIIKIDENNYIKKIDFEKRGNSFSDVIFNNNGKEIFVGRYILDTKNIKVLYREGKILVYSDKFIDGKGMKITKVYTLYDILDDVCYSMSEKDLIKIFDPVLDDSYLENPNKLSIYNDVEKRHRLSK